jgi:hypothetical protein
MLALKVPLIVWAAVLVMKSLELAPVSLLNLTLLTAVVGAVVSSVYAWLLEIGLLPLAALQNWIDFPVPAARFTVAEKLPLPALSV